MILIGIPLRNTHVHSLFDTIFRVIRSCLEYQIHMGELGVKFIHRVEIVRAPRMRRTSAERTEHSQVFVPPPWYYHECNDESVLSLLGSHCVE